MLIKSSSKPPLCFGKWLGASREQKLELGSKGVCAPHRPSTTTLTLSRIPSGPVMLTT